MKALDVYHQTDGDVTKAFYADLDSRGIRGKIATAIFRAHKRSSAAKRYSKRYKRRTYDVKQWSLEQVSILLNSDDTHGITWGWKSDPYTPGYEWVLYIDLPQGQISFHTKARGVGPYYQGEWDGMKNISVYRVAEFCDEVMSGTVSEPGRSREVVHPELQRGLPGFD